MTGDKILDQVEAEVTREEFLKRVGGMANGMGIRTMDAYKIIAMVETQFGKERKLIERQTQRIKDLSEALADLVHTKDYKESYGKTEIYKDMRDKAWVKARMFLEGANKV